MGKKIKSKGPNMAFVTTSGTPTKAAAQGARRTPGGRGKR